MTLELDSLAEIESRLGVTLPPGPWLTVDQARVNTFAEATGDHQWIHVDAVRAQTSNFGGTIAHGYLLVSMIPVLASQIYRMGYATARLNYGVNRVRFPTPVRVGSRVRLYATLSALEHRTDGALLTTQFQLELEGSSKPACVAECLTLLLP